MDWHQKTIKVYDDTAEEMAAYFRGIGSRVDDIEKALELANKPHGGRVVELGCGDGRDAAEILKRVAWYEGIDPSTGFLNIAKKTNPTGTFVLADALSYNYPNELDVIFAFASLLHSNKEDLGKVLEKAHNALRTGGIFYISLKERPEYVAEIKKDIYGERMFYYYTIPLIEQLAEPSFKRIYHSRQTIGDTDWFTIALKKV